MLKKGWPKVNRYDSNINEIRGELRKEKKSSTASKTIPVPFTRQSARKFTMPTKAEQVRHRKTRGKKTKNGSEKIDEQEADVKCVYCHGSYLKSTEDWIQCQICHG